MNIQEEADRILHKIFADAKVKSDTYGTRLASNMQHTILRFIQELLNQWYTKWWYIALQEDRGDK